MDANTLKQPSPAQIAQEMMSEIKNANSDSTGVVDLSPVPELPRKPRPKLNDHAVRLLCRGKNFAAVQFLIRNLDEAGRKAVSEIYKTTDAEVGIVKQAIEESLNEHGSPELIETINRWAGSPFIAWIELEVDRFLMVRGTLKEFQIPTPTPKTAPEKPEEDFGKVAA